MDERAKSGNKIENGKTTRARSREHESKRSRAREQEQENKKTKKGNMYSIDRTWSRARTWCSIDNMAQYRQNTI